MASDELTPLGAGLTIKPITANQQRTLSHFYEITVQSSLTLLLVMNWSVANGDPTRMKDARMILFNCWVGLSASELVALALEDVDKERGGIHVRRAKVAGEFKVPKERSRIRFVEQISPAYNHLMQILAEVEGSSPEEIEVTQRDAITKRKEKITLLFRNSVSLLPWNGRTLSEWFTDHLKRSNVHHRGANQCRHTFASQVL